MVEASHVANLWIKRPFIPCCTAKERSTFASNCDLPHDLAVIGVLNVLGGVLSRHYSDICCFRASTLLALKLVVNWSVFTIYQHIDEPCY